MRLEITETETREGNLRQRAVQIMPNPPYCPYCSTQYKNYGSVANAATAIWQHCQSCASDTLKVKDAGPRMPAFSMRKEVLEQRLQAFQDLGSDPPQGVAEGTEWR